MYVLRRAWRHKTLPPLLKTFCWRLVRRAIGTGERAKKYSNKISKLCVTCNISENDAHLFFHCTFARAVWFSANPPLCSSMLPSELDGVQESLGQLVNQQTTDDQMMTILTTLWWWPFSPLSGTYGKPEMIVDLTTKNGLFGRCIMQWRLTSLQIRYTSTDKKDRYNTF